MTEDQIYLAREVDKDTLEILKPVGSAKEGIDLGLQQPADQRPALRIVTVHAARLLEALQTTEFKVISRSSNTNAFGLRGHVLLSRAGDACEMGLNSLNELEHGHVVQLRHGVSLSPQQLTSMLAAKLHAEIPRYIGKAPPEVIKEAWG